ncbi:PREDICTED: leucine-rich repeat-containing protein 37A3-like [Chinchilla lanigera]|uniref:leucine-rich repeat-containing protein 37A3-like n=1 Tax=Chinchilla lanigera TaxID=34839 RepID=UPI0006966909|nr:PREDICTED: leucine-rich repeat-containing protein 37A3-like [Chinchilla lanigera]
MQAQAQEPNLTPVIIEALNLEHHITPVPSSEVQLSPNFQETPPQPPEPSLEPLGEHTVPHGVTNPRPLGQHTARPETLPSPVVQPLDMGFTLSPNVNTEAEHAVIPQEVTVSPLKHPELTLVQPEQMQAEAQEPNLTPVITQARNLEHDITPVPTAEVQLSPNFQETTSQPPETSLEPTGEHTLPHGVTSPRPLDQHTALPAALPSVVVQALDMGFTLSPQVTTEAEHAIMQQEVTLTPLKHPELTLVQPEQMQAQAQEPNLTPVIIEALNLEHHITPVPSSEVQLSPNFQETPSQPPEPSFEDVGEQIIPHGVTHPRPLGQHIGPPPTLPSVLVQALDMGFTLSPQVTTESEHAVIPQEVTVTPLKHPELTLVQLEPMQAQAQELNLTPVIIKPLNLDHHITPVPSSEVQLFPNFQETPSQPPEPSLEPIGEQIVPHGVTHPRPLGQRIGLPATLPSVVVQPLDLSFPLSSKIIIEGEDSVALQEITASPVEHPEMILALPEEVQSQHPNLSPITVHPSDLEHSMSAPLATGTELTSLMQEGAPQPPEPSTEAVGERTGTPEMTNPLGQDAAHHPTLPMVPIQPLQVELIVNAAPTTESEPLVTLQRASTPALVQPELTLIPPNLTPVTFQPFNVEQHTKQYSVQMEQNSTGAVNICDLCACENEALSCIDLSPMQRLQQVPVVEPNSFTVLNFQGNSIRAIPEGIWKTYRWVHKLNLSENYITELRKDSFEGLLSLQYLNLQCNLLTELSFGTFEAWHGMQFLKQV